MTADNIINGFLALLLGGLCTLELMIARRAEARAKLLQQSAEKVYRLTLELQVKMDDDSCATAATLEALRAECLTGCASVENRE